MGNEINFKIDKDLCDEVKEIAQNKFPLRKILSYADAIKEALLEFANARKNQRYKNKKNTESTSSINQENTFKI